MAETKTILWDTCVLYRWLTKFPTDYVDHIQAHVDDAKAGKSDIFISTISLAELRPSMVNQASETPVSILRRLCSFITPVDTLPDIMSLAGELRDNEYLHVDGDPKRAKVTLTLGDAVHLATGIWMREYSGAQNVEFHTFDDGKGKGNAEGRGVSMLSFHNWTRNLENSNCVQQAIELKRKLPDHALCKLPPKGQLDRFKEAAREVATDDDEARFNEKLRKLVRQKPADKTDTSDD